MQLGGRTGQVRLHVVGRSAPEGVCCIACPVKVAAADRTGTEVLAECLCDAQPHKVINPSMQELGAGGEPVVHGGHIGAGPVMAFVLCLVWWMAMSAFVYGFVVELVHATLFPPLSADAPAAFPIINGLGERLATAINVQVGFPNEVQWPEVPLQHVIEQHLWMMVGGQEATAWFAHITCESVLDTRFGRQKASGTKNTHQGFQAEGGCITTTAVTCIGELSELALRESTHAAEAACHQPQHLLNWLERGLVKHRQCVAADIVHDEGHLGHLHNGHGNGALVLELC